MTAGPLTRFPTAIIKREGLTAAAAICCSCSLGRDITVRQEFVGGGPDEMVALPEGLLGLLGLRWGGGASQLVGGSRHNAALVQARRLSY